MNKYPIFKKIADVSVSKLGIPQGVIDWSKYTYIQGYPQRHKAPANGRDKRYFDATKESISKEVRELRRKGHSLKYPVAIDFGEFFLLLTSKYKGEKDFLKSLREDVGE